MALIACEAGNIGKEGGLYHRLEPPEGKHIALGREGVEEV